MDFIGGIVAFSFLGCAIGSVIGMRNVGCHEWMPLWYQSWGDIALLSAVAISLFLASGMSQRRFVTHVIALSVVWFIPGDSYLLFGERATAPIPDGLREIAPSLLAGVMVFAIAIQLLASIAFFTEARAERRRSAKMRVGA